MTATNTGTRRGTPGGTGDLPIAVNTFVWHSPLTGKLLEERLPLIARWGFDAVELPLENPGDWDPARAAEMLIDLGLRSVVGAVFGPGRELAAADADVVSATKEYVRTAVRVAERQGSPLVIGPMYTSVGRTWRTDEAERRAVIGELRLAIAELADYAGAHGVRLAVRLLHLQVCGNDRGAPGGDHLDWDGIRASLAAVDYRGMLGIESFTADNASIATAASIWRPLASTQDALAADGLRFLQQWRSGWPTSPTRDHGR